MCANGYTHGDTRKQIQENMIIKLPASAWEQSVRETSSETNLRIAIIFLNAVTNTIRQICAFLRAQTQLPGHRAVVVEAPTLLRDIWELLVRPRVLPETLTLYAVQVVITFKHLSHHSHSFVHIRVSLGARPVTLSSSHSGHSNTW